MGHAAKTVGMSEANSEKCFGILHSSAGFLSYRPWINTEFGLCFAKSISGKLGTVPHPF